MAIESVRMTEARTFEVVEDEITKYVPDDMANADRQRLEEWEGWPDEVQPYTPPPPPVPYEISDRQCFQQLAIMGFITQAEALAYLGTGVLPAAFEAFVEALPAEKQFPARMALMANTFRRDDEWVHLFGTMQGMTSEQIDQLWIAAAEF
jgi:hypothetical protein